MRKKGKLQFLNTGLMWGDMFGDVKQNTRSVWLPCHVIGKDQVIAMGHAYIEYDVISHKLKTFDKNSNFEISWQNL